MKSDVYIDLLSHELNILLADDDIEDSMFFEEALKELPFLAKFTAVHDGQQLMNYLAINSGQLPDVLFLDLNMPRKNGSECFAEIKQDQQLKQLPVIIYSTSLSQEKADEFYKKGAYYYLPKPFFGELKQALYDILTMITQKTLHLPVKEKFVLKSH